MNNNVVVTTMFVANLTSPLPSFANIGNIVSDGTEDCIILIYTYLVI